MGTLHEVTLTLSDATEDLEQHRKNMHQEHCFVCDNVDPGTKVKSMTISN